ncbi:hypothetical protein [Candidatus Phytoplasma solani]|uniref:Uncharacterized protein n=1 Tax=Candidatus Phytoplasma solani TaxID=69896 RepID=A0A421NY12_9MOLU|nr:hypothetical protein [Candidatus Phytoplasma solani]RMI88810.1 hypothetical protein PSSA1_v1c2370 [Candidatus Phytoplasma solani]
MEEYLAKKTTFLTQEISIRVDEKLQGREFSVYEYFNLPIEKKNAQIKKQGYWDFEDLGERVDYQSFVRKTYPLWQEFVYNIKTKVQEEISTKRAKIQKHEESLNHLETIHQNNLAMIKIPKTPQTTQPQTPHTPTTNGTLAPKPEETDTTLLKPTNKPNETHNPNKQKADLEIKEEEKLIIIIELVIVKGFNPCHPIRPILLHVG